MSVHSTVTYVEPNAYVGRFGTTDADSAIGYEGENWAADNVYERAPRLEDYCISLDIEVELSSRDTQGTKEVVILRWNSGEKETVSFFGGTKIGGYNMNKDGFRGGSKLSSPNYLTTYYSDLYIGDLIDYGTTEMIGIKSVDIQYEKSCVPIISIKFTDVRGYSLFQPTELNRTSTYQGIKGLSVDNVAQSFFQCFFKLPLPRFTIYIKGFYGKPVAYVVMCDKFDTNFNSETGDYDIDTRFIGFTYSFLTDISFTALMAAPYSDFVGKDHWEQAVNEGRFVLPDKYKTENKPMPTLYDIYNEFTEITKKSTEEDSVTTEETSEEESSEESSSEEEGNLVSRTNNYFKKVKEKAKNGGTEKNEEQNSESSPTKTKSRELRDKNVISANTSTEVRVYVSDDEDAKVSKQKRIVYKEEKKDDSTTQNDIEKEKKAEKIEKLQKIREDYKKWYRELFKQLTEKYGAKLCFDFKDGKSENSNWHKIILLTDKYAEPNLAKDYKTFSDAFKKTNKDLYESVKELGSKSNDIKLPKNVSKDFSEYTLFEIFNPCSKVSGTSEYVFNGFAKDTKVKKEEIINRFFLDDGDTQNINVSKEWVNQIKSTRKNVTLSTIYNGNGDLQMTHGYIIDVDYSVILDQLKELGVSTEEDKMNDAIANDLANEKLLALMSWYPSVENFMKIVMAHVETYMSILYEVKNQCVNRTPEEMGITLGNGGNVSDVNDTSKILPPFPRITKEEMGDDGIVSTVDEWVGNLSGAHFIEEDAVNGLLNGIQAINQLRDINEAQNENGLESGEDEYKMMVKFPITSFDFFFTKSPYGSETDIIEDKDAFVKKTALRMFDILCINNFRSNNRFLSNVEKLGKLEGYNFFYSGFKFNKKMLSILESLKAEDILKSGILDENFWVTKYKTSSGHLIYPRQNISLKNLQESVTKFKNGIDVNNDDICVWTNNENLTAKDTDKLLKCKNDNSFGNVFITSKQFNLIKECLDKVPTDAKVGNDDLSDIYNNQVIGKAISVNEFDTSEYAKMFNESDILSGDISTLVNEAEKGDIKSCEFIYCKDLSNPLGSNRLSEKNLNLYTSKIYSSNTKKDVGYNKLSEKEKKIGIFLLGFIDSINTKKASETLTSGTFTYVPTLFVLMVGFALGLCDNISALGLCDNIREKTITFKGLLNALGIKEDTLKNLFIDKLGNLDSLSPLTRTYFVRYFKKWCDSYGSFLINDVIGTKILDTSRSPWVYKSGTNEIKRLTTALLRPLLVGKGNINYYINKKIENYKVEKTKIITYFNSFLLTLKGLCGLDTSAEEEALEESSGNDTSYAQNSSSTEDMKKELYRYLKLVHDKWIPTSEMSEWEFETFFDSDKEEIIRQQGSNGHLFHFIDSFYNKIGHKLLINPTGLYEVVRDALEASNTNTMLLGFISDILGKNKTMLLCLQNFADLSKKESMEMMFRPLAYNSLMDVRKHPDFVIVYPYEPSKYLNSDNSEFKDDSFMLNDETFTPLAIKSRGGNEDSYYNLPAFGVSYGKQYQSYFKKINVGMKNPIATQQSLIAKQALLNESRNGAKTAVAQDVYDIYATQSYTCTVEMMGCAWVQPLMYFVLTNVPLFRGSYLIMKVTHHITPGNMTTQFMGTRMANIANTFVKDIFTDEQLNGNSDGISAQNRLAYIDNDCPYKVYSIFGDDDNIDVNSISGLKLGKDSDESAMKLISAFVSMGYSDVAGAAVAGNVMQETSFASRYVDNMIKANHTAGMKGGICQWQGDRLTKLLKWDTSAKGTISTPEPMPPFGKQILFIDKEAKANYKSAVKVLENAKNEIDLEYTTKKFDEIYEGGTLSNRVKYAKEFLQKYRSGSHHIPKKTSESSKPTNDDITEGFLNAVKKSIASTNRNVPIKKDTSYTAKNGIKIVRDGSNSNNEMPFVFDIILNGYYEYVQSLSWVINGNDFTSKPSSIIVTVSEKPKAQERRITIYRDGHKNEDESKKFGSDSSSVNGDLLKSLYKKYKKPSKDIPQFTSEGIFSQVKLTDCNTLVSEHYPSGGNSSWANAVDTMGKWYEKNVHDYAHSTVDCSLVNGKVRIDCSGFASACLQYFGVFKNPYAPRSADFTTSEKVAEQLEKGGFKKMAYSFNAVQPYDILSFQGHVEIFAVKGKDEGSSKSYGWGNINDGQVHNGKQRPGMPHRYFDGDKYKVIWRCVK